MLKINNEELYEKIKKLPKMTNLHIHSNTIFEYYAFKKFVENNKKDSIIDLDIKKPTNWEELSQQQVKMKDLYDDRKIYPYIIEYYLDKCLEDGIVYSELRGIMATFTDYKPHNCKGYKDEYIYYVYDRVLLIHEVIYKWKLNKIPKSSKHYKYYSTGIDKIYKIYENMRINGKCDNLQLYDNDYKYQEIVCELEIEKSDIPIILLMNFKFILGHSKGKSDRLLEYLDTARYVNKLLGYNFIMGYDLYAPEHIYSNKQIAIYENNIIKINNKYSEFNYFAHSGETHDDKLGKKNIEFSIKNGVRRIGHGFQVLEDKIKLPEHPVFIEVCPYSNYILGYYDINKHPARNHIYNNKIIISISNDDPGTFGYDNLSYDYYLIFKEWKLNNKDLYKLILNGLLAAKYGGGISDRMYKLLVKLSDKFFIQHNADYNLS